MNRTAIPPDHVPLQFARSKTGRVHILSWMPDPDDDDYDPGAGSPVAIAEALMAKALMLCGLRLFLPFAGVGGDFADDDLCVTCVRALGDQQWRAFHADVRGPAAEENSKKGPGLRCIGHRSGALSRAGHALRPA